MRKQIQLDGFWEFTLDAESSDLSFAPEKAFPRGQWLRASVPGTIHTDLMENSLLEDPFYRDNELKVQWVDRVNWLYRKKFDVPENLRAMTAVHLVAEGLDTLADIFINRQKVARTQNMHITHRFDVQKYLKAGKNELRIRFNLPTLYAKQLEKEHGVLCHTHESHRLYMRKAQYSFGWDWGPILPTSGIWKPIYLEAFDSIRIKDVSVESTLDESFQNALVEIKIETERFSDDPADFLAAIEMDGIKKEIQLENDEESLELNLKNPKLWWPIGFGEQKLYRLNLQILSNGKLQDSRSLRLGIRKLELIQEKDEWGESFYFKINDVPIFCKGANWIPADNFLPRVNEQKYQRLLQMAKDANMNMIRIWGGGIYEQDIFYDLCDELGLLIWHDFMFACGAYPEYDDYRKNIAQEIESVIKRLRNHPCIAIWCGNNENEWIWYRSTGVSYKDMPGLSLFHELIPSICSKLDPSRPYWPSTPFGGDDPNSQETGNRHQWDIWSRWQDYTTVENDHGRFISEFGFQAPANLSTFKKVTLPEDRHPQSEIMEFHNKQIEGQERLFRFLAGHVRMPVSFEDFIYKCQVVQGEALKQCLEHWRRNKFRTAGCIIWQLNDCWPVASWALIDSELIPKAAYFYVRRAFQPRLVSFSQREENIEIWITNDTLESCIAALKIKGQNFTGEIWFEKELNSDVHSNCSFKAFELNWKDLNLSAHSSYLKAELWIAGELVSENRHFFRRFKHLHLTRPVFEKSLRKLDKALYSFKISSSCFAKSVQIDSNIGCEMNDNCFDLDANSVKEVEIKVFEDKDTSLENISINSLTF